MSEKDNLELWRRFERDGPQSHYDAFVALLVLMVTAPTERQSDEILEIGVREARLMTPAQVASAQRAAEDILKAAPWREEDE